jgi:hypothetical protein
VPASTDFTEQYRKYGPILYSHFFRALGEEGSASQATSSAFEQLWSLGLTDELAIVRWVRSRPVSRARA